MANPAYLGSEACVDPEEAFVASLSGGQMLTLPALAARNRSVVNGHKAPVVAGSFRYACGSGPRGGRRQGHYSFESLTDTGKRRSDIVNGIIR